MSLFSTELHRVIEAKGTQADFAEKTGWNQGIVSGYMSGRRIPRKFQLKRILDAAGTNNSPALLQAYLEDSIPPGYSKAVEINPRKGAATRAVPEVEYAMPRRLEAAFRGLRRKAQDNKTVAELVEALAEALHILDAPPEPEFRRKGGSKKKKTA